MGKAFPDLSDKGNAQASMNKTALVGVWIINIVITLAYFLEVIKGVRSIGSYLLVVAFALLPSAIAQVIYSKDKAAKLIRYISGFGFGLPMQK